MELLEPRPGETVLELAAGVGDTGFAAAGLLEPGGLLLSTDVAPEMLAAARRRAAELTIENVEFRVVDAAAIDLPDESVDGVLCRFGVMLVPEPADALAEIARVLRPGGRAALAVWASPEENGWMTAAGRAALELGLIERPDPHAPGPFRLADAEQLRALVARAGLRVATLEDAPVAWHADSLDDWWESTRDVSRMLATLLDRLDAAGARKLREGAERRLARYVTADGSLDVPGLARLLLAEKPD